jgi:hypothetical protein
MNESFLGTGLKADFVSHDVIITGLDIIRIMNCRAANDHWQDYFANPADL